MPKICFFSPQNKLHNNQSHAAFFLFFFLEKGGEIHSRSHECLQANTQLTTVSIRSVL